MTSQTSLTSHTNPPQKLDRLVRLETSQTSQSPEPITAGISDTPKTSLKTNTKNDDDARADEVFSVMTKRLDAAVKKLTGKPSSRIEAEKWGTLAELLILEMEVAASRTETISSVPAFLTEILRRKLLHGSNSAPAELPKAKTDTVGRPSAAGEYEIKPLNEQSRQSALLELREFIGEEFLKDFQKWYTPGDWKWLTHELDKIQESGK